jgi:hypothetical protein
MKMEVIFLSETSESDLNGVVKAENYTAAAIHKISYSGPPCFIRNLVSNRNVRLLVIRQLVLFAAVWRGVIWGDCCELWWGGGLCLRHVTRDSCRCTNKIPVKKISPKPKATRDSQVIPSAYRAIT